MPEGDTIHTAAATLRAVLLDHTILDLGGSHRSLLPERRRFLGATIVGIEAHGKHLLIHVDRGWSIRSHMGMTGHWRTFPPGEAWTTTAGKARIVIETAESVAVCFAAPYIEVGTTAAVLANLQRIGPDLIDDDPPLAAIAAAALAHPGPTLADLLLDQSVASGIGNVYKSEVLYLERLSPHDPPSSQTPAKLERVYRRAARLLSQNVGSGARSTTGRSGPGQRHWVYDRSGKPCRRCNTTIKMQRHGDLDRSTYWCPRCQPARDTSG